MILQSDLKIDMRVSYRAIWSNKPEYGTVSSFNDDYVFVKFDEQVAKLGYAGTTAQACLLSQLTEA